MVRTARLTAAALAMSAVCAPAFAQYGQPAYPAPQTQAQPAAGPLASIFSCQAGGNRQSTGALIGALAGGAIGNRVADNERTLGTVLGAAIGAAAGSYIGCRMQVADQQRAQASAQFALEQGRSQFWTEPQTGASGRTDIVETYYLPAPPAPRLTVETVAFSPGIERPREYQPSEGTYTATAAAVIRSGPSARAQQIGSLRVGDRVDALVRVEGSPWLLAVRGASVLGYVSETNLRLQSPQLAQPQQAQNGPLCRVFDQTFQPRGGQPDVQRYRACRDAQGQWVIQA
jgi:hypothetical protein